MKNITYILLLFSLSLFGQRPNNFNDSTNFARPVRFAVPPYIIQGAGNGKVLTSDANGRATWQTFSSSGVTQQALNDSIARLDSTINAIPTPLLTLTDDTLTISGGNSVILPVYIQIDSATITSYDVLNSQNAPPGSPATGDTYLVGTSPSGAWVGHAKDIAEWNGSSWDFTDGVQGDFLYNATNALTYIFRSGNWVQTTGIPALNNGNTISSGLRIGTNNARSLTFETNNVNRGRFDSIGRFYIYDTSLHKANKYLQIDSITGRLIASDISGGGGTSALFPNGYVVVNESRDFNSGDANKLLGIKSDDITLSMPSINPFGEGDFVGIQNTNDYKNTHIILKEGSEPTLIGDEVFIFALVDIGGGIYVPQPLTGEIYDENEENEKSITRYLYDQSQNAIPLSGTKAGKPVTGDIEFKSGYDAHRLYKTNEDEDIVQSICFNDSHLEIKGTNVANTQNASIKLYADNVTIEGTGIGLRGGINFTPNITDLDYTQKIYVDNAISSNRKVDTSYIFRNATLDSTCMITVINGNSYRSCAKDSLPTVSSTSTTTFTNKRITARVDSTTSSATPTINTDNVDTYKLTAQAVDITSFTTNLSGTPTDDQILHIVIIGTATRAITWGTKFEASTVALPTTTSGTTRLDVYFIWNTATSKWRCGGVW